MKNNRLKTLKKQQKILYILIPTSVSMAITKYLGILSIGGYPFFVELGIATLATVLLIVNSMQIKKWENIDK